MMMFCDVTAQTVQSANAWPTVGNGEVECSKYLQGKCCGLLSLYIRL